MDDRETIYLTWVLKPANGNLPSRMFLYGLINRAAIVADTTNNVRAHAGESPPPLSHSASGGGSERPIKQGW